MTITPLHPNLDITRPMTADEMLECLRYEGMFRISARADIDTAMRLSARGLALLEHSPNLGTTVILREEGR